MGFTSNDGSCRAKCVPPRVRSVSKNSKPFDQLKHGLRGHEEVLDHRHGNKAAAVFPDSDIEDVSIEKQLNYTEGLFDESNSMWLSSDCKSPSLFSSDDSQSQDVREPDCWDLSLDSRFSSILTLSGSCGIFLDRDTRVSLFDGSRINPIEEASLVLDRTHEGIDDEDLQAEVVRVHNSVGNEVRDSSMGCSESGESSYERSFCEDSSLFESSCTSLSAHDDTPSVRDFDRTGIWVSSLDLDGEDSDWVLDREPGFDDFESDFPSPSYNATRNLLIRASNCRFKSSPAQVHEAKTPSEDFDSDEPLFWPFNQNSYWHPEFESNFLCISPRKIGVKTGNTEDLHGSKSVGSKLQQRNNPPGPGKNMPMYRRRILLSSKPTLSTVTDCKIRDPNCCVKKISAMPSRLSRSTQASSEQHPCNISLKKRPLQKKASKHKHSGAQKLTKPSSVVEAGDFQDLAEEGVPIEKLVGLNEFDGHEGIDMDFDENQLSIGGSPCKNPNVVSSRDVEWSTNNVGDQEIWSCATSDSSQNNLIGDACSTGLAKGHEALVDRCPRGACVHDLSFQSSEETAIS